MSSPSGLLILDKPAGMSSRTAIDVVQRLVRPAKVGHAGTLDPIATGMLVVCVGSATRLIPFVQPGRKVYRATFRLGVTSVTDDIEGVVTDLPGATRPTPADIEDVLPEFVGTIEQIPPIFSAVHVAGRRAYELARQGQTVTLAAKSVEVHRFKLVAFDTATQVLEAEIECGAGTYVRSLGRDLAKRLGTAAVMTALRRTAVGAFHIDSAVSVNDLAADNVRSALLPLAAAVSGLPRFDCDSHQADAICHGRAIPKPEGPWLRADESVALFAPDGRLVAVGVFEPRDATLKPKIVFPADHDRRQARLDCCETAGRP